MGKTYLIFGGTGVAGDWSGLSISGLGDTDGDGLADIAISAGYMSNVLRAHIISGSSLVNYQYTLSNTGHIITNFSTETSNDVFTFSGMGDVNSDGYDDLVINDSIANPHSNRSANRIYAA